MILPIKNWKITLISNLETEPFQTTAVLKTALKYNRIYTNLSFARKTEDPPENYDENKDYEKFEICR